MAAYEKNDEHLSEAHEMIDKLKKGLLLFVDKEKIEAESDESKQFETPVNRKKVLEMSDIQDTDQKM